MSNLKFTFEGANLAEVKEHIANFLGDLNNGSTAAEAAGVAEKKKTPKKDEKPKEEKLTLEKIQLKCSSLVENADDKTAMKGAIKEVMEEFMVKKVTDLEESEYAAFMEKISEL